MRTATLWKQSALILLAAGYGLLIMESNVSGPRVCPYRVHDWTVAGPGGEYGIIEMGYMPSGRLPSLTDSSVAVGPLGSFSLLLGLLRASIVLLVLVALRLVWKRKSTPSDCASRNVSERPILVPKAVSGERKPLGVWVLVCLIPLAGTFAFVSHEFGTGSAAFLSLIIALPTVIAVRFCRRWFSVTKFDLVFLALLFCVATGSIIFVVRAWYDNGLHRAHAEDVKWNKFENQLRRDPAFRGITVHKTIRYDIHWASGSVNSEADLARVRMLAAECGIQGRLDGPFAYSVSLTVEPQ